MHARTMNQGENNRNTRRRILLPLEKQVMKLRSNWESKRINPGIFQSIFNYTISFGEYGDLNQASFLQN